jgi:hypothetical protein
MPFSLRRSPFVQTAQVYSTFRRSICSTPAFVLSDFREKHGLELFLFQSFVIGLFVLDAPLFHVMLTNERVQSPVGASCQGFWSVYLFSRGGVKIASIWQRGELDSANPSLPMITRAEIPDLHCLQVGADIWLANLPANSTKPACGCAPDHPAAAVA